MKKVLLLGGLRYLIPVIETAHQLGYYVITCDYLPGNIAHLYSDEYHNVSVTDKEAVLAIAQELKIDGIMSFAVDPGVLTAAYVAEKLNLPSVGSYATVEILQNKDKFRKFLSDNGFNVPNSMGVASIEEALARIDQFNYPLIVKPTDSAGSKGVARIDCKEELREAFANAYKFSNSGRIIIEEFIEKEGYSSDSDCFSLDGELKFVSFSDQRFDTDAANAYVPSSYSWPASMSEKYSSYLVGELQRLISLLNLKTSIYNIETRIGVNGKPYIMELSPRGGGNRISEILKYATNTDLIRLSLLAAVGDPVGDIEKPKYNGVWAEMVLYSDREGSFKKLSIGKMAQKFLVEEDLWIREGDFVHPFTGANETIGTLIFRFESQEQLDENFPLVMRDVKIEVN